MVATADQAPFRIPLDMTFMNDEFMAAPELERVAGRVIDLYPAKFGFIRPLKVHWLWKRQGGKSQGRARISHAQSASGLLGHYAAADFLVWFAADNIRAAKFTEHQVEAQVFHELCHLAWDGEKQVATVRGHDFEGFLEELEEYGAWQTVYEQVARAVSLPLLDYLERQVSEREDDDHGWSANGHDAQEGVGDASEDEALAHVGAMDQADAAVEAEAAGSPAENPEPHLGGRPVVPLDLKASGVEDDLIRRSEEGLARRRRTSRPSGEPYPGAAG